MLKRIAIALLVSVVAVGGAAVAASATQGGGGHTSVTLCHRTGSASGGNQHDGYDLITVDITSAGQAATAKGHNSHEQVGNGPGPDLIPAYTYTARDGTVTNYPGKGLDFVFADGETGVEVLANGCQFSEESPTPPVIAPAASLTAKCASGSSTATATLDNSASVNGSDTDATVDFTITVNGSQVGGSYSVKAGDTATVDITGLVKGDKVQVFANDGSLASLTISDTCTKPGPGPGPGPRPSPNPSRPQVEKAPAKLASTL